MVFNLYAVFDRVVGSFNPTFQAVRDEIAARDFITSTVDLPHVKDLYLVRLASFDSETGVVKNHKCWDVMRDCEFDPEKEKQIGIQLDLEVKENAS